MGMSFSMALNLVLLVAMVATNILSFYHLSTTSSFFHPTTPPTTTTTVPPSLLHQLRTIHSTINRLSPHHQQQQHTPTTSTPSDLLLFSSLSPIPTSCHHHPHLLHQFMNYTPFTPCPTDTLLADSLILRGCHPLPRRRCFSPTPSNPSLSNPDSNIIWDSYPSATCPHFNCLNPKLRLNFQPNHDDHHFFTYKSDLDLTIPQLMDISKRAASLIRLGIDIGGGNGDFALKMKQMNVTVLTSTMNLGVPYSEYNAIRGVVPLHAPLQQRLPVFDGVVDLVRCGHAINRWVPNEMLEFLLYDVDRVLRGGGYLWIDHFFSKGDDMKNVYKGMIDKLGYKIVKWATGKKMDSSGVKNGELYLTALLQKPKTR